MFIASNYHYIRPNFDTLYPGIFGMTPIQFENQLVRLSKIADFVAAADIVSAIENDYELSKSAILVTFDDGLKEQYEVALPILDRMGIPAVFYINTSNITEGKVSLVHKIHLLLVSLPFEEYQNYVLNSAVKLYGKTLELVNKAIAVKHYNYDSLDRAMLKYFLNFILNFEEQSSIIGTFFEETFPGKEPQMCEDMYMSKDNIVKLGNRWYLGSHSHRHIPLGLYSEEVIDEDIKISNKIIKEITGFTPFTISYPYGSIEAVGELVQSKAKENGLKFGFTMERAGNPNFNQPLGLSRFDSNDLPGGKSAIFKDQDFFAGISSRKMR
jgi:peptidoglycan/xylan/chitin deacetylase (PgdA/CDA1 family)